MNTIGTILKEIREQKGYQLQDIHNKTKIDLSLLSRIENGKRIPTKEQVIKLINEYSCNEKDILIHWISDKVVSEIQEEEFGIEALKLAEEKILYGQSSLSFFPDFLQDRTHSIESRRYIGSKAKLANWIIDIIRKETINAKVFLDIFAGTAVVAREAMNHFEKVIINDNLFSNNIIYNAFFKKGKWNKEKLQIITGYFNQIKPNEIEENYFSINFGDKYFEHGAAKVIGFIRQNIEDRKNELTEKEYNILLASLIYSIDKIANTVGHFDAYIKKPIKISKVNIRLIEPVDFKAIEIYCQDANLLGRKMKADIAYIDPPYNSRQYSRFYHLYETLTKWDKPELHGVALKPTPDNMSLYCTVKAKDTFYDLVKNLQVNCIAVSYNNTYNSKSSSSENKIKLEEIESILKTLGETRIYECTHKFFNAGKTEFDNHKELLFITKINGK